MDALLHLVEVNEKKKTKKTKANPNLLTIYPYIHTTTTRHDHDAIDMTGDD